METQQAEDNKKTLKIVVIVLVVTAVLSAMCCGGAALFGVGMFNEVVDMEKAYYPECESLNEDQACASCCRERGHSGHAFGDWINEEGKLCGCLGDGNPDGVAPAGEQESAAGE